MKCKEKQRGVLKSLVSMVISNPASLYLQFREANPQERGCVCASARCGGAEGHRDIPGRVVSPRSAAGRASTGSTAHRKQDTRKANKTNRDGKSWLLNTAQGKACAIHKL